MTEKMDEEWAKKFIRVWEESPDILIVSKILKIDRRDCSNLASFFRRKKIPLKSHRQKVKIFKKLVFSEAAIFRLKEFYYKDIRRDDTKVEIENSVECKYCEHQTRFCKSGKILQGEFLYKLYICTECKKSTMIILNREEL